MRAQEIVVSIRDFCALSPVVRHKGQLHAVRPMLLQASATAALLIFASSTATAQSVATAANPSSASNSDGQLEEIVVTAQHRSERLQDVPVAVTSVSADKLARQGVSGTTDLGQSVPSLVFNSTIAGQVQPTLRGVGSKLFDPTSEGAVAIYVDDVYMATPAGNMFTLMGVKQIDVLNGPQGTLYGRNATGGAILIQTLDPSSEPRVDAAATYGNYNYRSLSGYVSVGLGSKVSTSLSALYEDQGDGYGRNLFTGNDANRFAINNISLRSIWMFEPSDSTSFRLSVDYSDIASSAARQKPPGSSSAIYAARGAVAPFGFPGRFNANSGVDALYRTEAGGISLKINQDLGPIQLTSISAYRKLLAKNLCDCDASTARVTNTDFKTPFRNYSQEVRINNQSGGAFNWVLGVYYYNSAGGYKDFIFNGAPFIAFEQQKNKAWAGFGQGTLALLENTSLTVGGRYTVEHQHYVFPARLLSLKQRAREPNFRVALDHHFTEDVMAYLSFNTGFKSGGYNLTAPGKSFEPEKLKAYEAGLKTELLDRALRLNFAAFLYKYSDQQVSSAGASFTGPVIPTGSLNFSIINAGASTIKGLEANFDYVPVRRLTISGGFSLIRGRYTNFPGQQYLDSNGQLVAANGFPAGAIVNVKGSPTVLTPTFVGNLSGSYRIPTRTGNFDLDLAVQHNSGFVWSQNSLAAKQAAYTLVNGSLSWASQSGGLGVKAWAKNITNKYYYSGLSVSGGFSASSAPPRTYGLTLSYHYR